MKLRDHTFLGLTQSLCPECLRVVPAKIVSRRNRVYFEKRCPEHGQRLDFVCSDVAWFDRLEHSVPGKVPLIQGVQPRNGCPLDCGLCTEHEQHTCIALLEITSSCNLTCPMCFASSAPGGNHMSVQDSIKAIDRLVAVEGQPEVLQLSGGEPTVHPQFLEILDYTCSQPIDVVMINTNGIRIARDQRFVESLAEYRNRIEVYFQLDGLEQDASEQLRGEPLLETKLQALDVLESAKINATLVSTVQTGVNENQLGDLIRFGMARPHVTGVSFQPATYCGRSFLPEDLEQRSTFPDIIHGIANQAPEIFQASDFLPLPCAHPNAHSLTYVYRSEGQALPLTRFIDIQGNMDLLANGITFTRDRARDLIANYLGRSCHGADCFDGLETPSSQNHTDDESRLAKRFFKSASDLSLNTADVMRITITSFMDAYNFDVRQLMKSCVHHVLPSGHLIPFSAYNVLYREGHVELPPLSQHDLATSQSVLVD